MDRTLCFTLERLSVKLSEYITVEREGRMTSPAFTDVDPQHHSMVSVPGLAPAVKQLQDVMLDTESIDDVGSPLEIMQQRGVEMGRLGRRTSDLMMSFYLVSPSGFGVECGWCGRTIDDERTWTVQNYRATSIRGHGPRP
jgi:hypothetical protein